MYIVHVSYGEYEEKVDCPLVVTNDYSKAQIFIAEQEAKEALIHERIALLNAWDKNYRDTHPDYKYDGALGWPKERIRWPSGLKANEITEEMKNKREEIKKHNDAIRDAEMQLVYKWQNEKRVAKYEYMTSIGIPEEKFETYLFMSYRNKRNFRIETIEVI